MKKPEEREAKKRKPDEKEVEALRDFEQEAKERRRQAGAIEDEAASDPSAGEYTPSTASGGNTEIGDDTLLQDLLESLAKDPIREPGDSGGEVRREVKEVQLRLAQ